MRSWIAGLAVSLVLAAASPFAQADAITQATDLGVAHLTLQPLEQAAGSDRIAVALGDLSTTLRVWPHSVRSDSFRVVLDRGNGVMEEITPPPSSAVRGTVEGLPGSIVAGSIVDGQMNLIVSAGEQSWTIQPAEGEAPGVHAVFEGAAILEQEGFCGVPDDARAPEEPAVHHLAGGFASRGTGEFRIAELALEADWRLYNDFFNRDEAALLQDLDSIVAAMAAIYERDVALTYELTTVLVRTTSASDPYTTNDPSALLGEFRAEWNQNQTAIRRDVAHLMTGRNIDGSVIGIAYLGVICGSSAYGVNQIRFTGNFNRRVALFAHELGHNWAAQHCNDDSECRIMCAGLGGCSGLGNPVRFAAGPIAQMSGHIGSRTCLDNVAVSLPISENFDGATLTPSIWSTSFGFELSSDGAAPSGSRVGRFVGSSSAIATVPLDLAPAPEGGVAVRFSARAESSDIPRLRTFVALPGGQNIRMGVFEAGNASAFTNQAFYVPASFNNTESVLRVIPEPGGAGWRIDDFTVELIGSSDAVASLPFTESFDRGALFLDSWQPSDVSVEFNAAAASSGDAFGTIPAGGRAESVAIDASDAGEIVFGVLASAPADAGGGDELILSYRESGGSWAEASRFAAASFPSDAFALAEVVLPSSAAHASLSVRVETAASGSQGVWRLEDIEVGAEARGSDCPADLAEPIGILDLADITAFTSGFIANDPIADLAAPAGIFDLADVNAFVSSFIAGCP